MNADEWKNCPLETLDQLGGPTALFIFSTPTIYILLLLSTFLPLLSSEHSSFFISLFILGYFFHILDPWGLSCFAYCPPTVHFLPYNTLFSSYSIAKKVLYQWGISYKKILVIETLQRSTLKMYMELTKSFSQKTIQFLNIRLWNAIKCIFILQI
jgi:hypothetical protein